MKALAIAVLLFTSACATPRNTDACTNVTPYYVAEIPPGYQVYSCPHPFYVPAHGWRNAMTSSAGQVFVTEGYEYKLPHEFAHAWDYYSGRGYRSDEWPTSTGSVTIYGH